MKHYPLIFGPTGGLVAGNGFVAHVLIRGRCLLEETDPEFCTVFGVNPGAVAGDGASKSEAYHDFMERMRLVVFEIAGESETFAEFKAQVEELVNATNGPNEHLWREAVELVRSGKVDLEGVRREDAEGAHWVKVDLVATQQPTEETALPIDPEMNESLGTFKLASGF